MAGGAPGGPGAAPGAASGAAPGGPTIRAVSGATAHRLAAGQAVADLSGAAKELVENALDAGASSVLVRLVRGGLESLEVVDDGRGVAPADFALLAARHATSKLARFEELGGVQRETFGFRGEALGALAALAELQVTTRSEGETAGAALTFNKRGELVGRTPAARSRGTTVTVKHLFREMPVRHKELQRTAKRELARLLSLLQAYALVSVGVRFVCSNVSEKGARSTLVSTQGGRSVLDNIATVLGAKTAGQVIPAKIELTAAGELLPGADPEAAAGPEEAAIAVEGYISKAAAGCGRTSGDRQFFYVNGRPVDLPKASKVCNEVYRSLSSVGGDQAQHCPIVVLDVKLPAASYDVNVTPDKRTVFMGAEKALLDGLRAGLERLWEPSRNTYAVNKVPTQQGLEDFRGFARPGKPSASADLEEAEAATGAAAAARDGRALGKGPSPAGSFSPPGERALRRSAARASISKPDFSSFVRPAKERSSAVHLRGSRGGDRGRAGPSKGNQVKLDALLSTKPDRRRGPGTRGGPEVLAPDEAPAEDSSSEEEDEEEEEEPEEEPEEEEEERERGPAEDLPAVAGAEIEAAGLEDAPASALEPGQALVEGGASDEEGEGVGEGEQEDNSFRVTPAKGARALVDLDITPSPDKDGARAAAEPPAARFRAVAVASDEDILMTQAPPQIEDAGVIQFSLALLKRKHSEAASADYGFATQLPRKSKKFKASTIDKPSADPSARDEEEAVALSELERVFDKQNFTKMRVIGQFNLGFIICQLGDDLFIVDQHASDERKNYEKLQRETVLNRQPMLRALPMGLSVSEELTLRDSMEIFEKNGFDFVEDPDTQKLCLSALPVSKNQTFGVEGESPNIGTPRAPASTIFRLWESFPPCRRAGS